MHGCRYGITIYCDTWIIDVFPHIANMGIQQGDRFILTRLICEHIAVGHISLVIITVIVDGFAFTVLIALLVGVIPGEVIIHISCCSDTGSVSLDCQRQHRTYIVHILQIIIAAAACVTAHSSKEQADANCKHQAGRDCRSPLGPAGHLLYFSISYIVDVFVLCFADGVE